MPRVLEFDRVVFRRGASAILDGVSLSVEAGETVALLGRSGSGKSTLLKLANGLLMPDAGEVRVEGRSTRDWDPIRLRRRTGYMLQEGGLFPHFTVALNIGLVPLLEGWEPQRIAARVEALLELIGLSTALAERLPAALSGGQRQRVGVARALAAEPPLLLCDEPFGALDPLTRAAIQREFAGLRNKLDGARPPPAALFVTHDLREALLLGTRVALLDEGRLVAIAPPSEFARSPHPLVRAYFEAVMELVPAQAEGSS